MTTPQPSATSLDTAAVEAVTAPLRELRPPTYGQLAAAYRRGREPNKLIEEFRKRYDHACVEACRIADEIAGEDNELRWRLSEEMTAVAVERRYEWWTGPALNVAKLLNPAVRQRDLARLERMLRRNVGSTITFEPRRTVSRNRPTRPGRTTVANRVRRTVRTAAPSRGDPDDPDPEEDWQDLDEWLSERNRALDALTAGQLRLDREGGS
jgi:hypothetical protein